MSLPTSDPTCSMRGRPSSRPTPPSSSVSSPLEPRPPPLLGSFSPLLSRHRVLSGLRRPLMGGGEILLNIIFSLPPWEIICSLLLPLLFLPPTPWEIELLPTILLRVLRLRVFIILLRLILRILLSPLPWIIILLLIILIILFLAVLPLPILPPFHLPLPPQSGILVLCWREDSVHPLLLILPPWMGCRW